MNAQHKLSKYLSELWKMVKYITLIMEKLYVFYVGQPVLHAQKDTYPRNISHSVDGNFFLAV